MGRVITGIASCDAGERPWRLFLPDGYDPMQPPMLLVLLHGCTQDAANIARGSRMDAVAESHGFMVLYPEQPEAFNPKTCWNWFETAHQHRDGGEPAIIASMIEDVLAEYPADPARVHIAGISAGAAMAGLVAVAYPERFATLASLSGVAWCAASNMMRALTVMANGAGADVPSPSSVIAGMGRHPYALPTMVLHGGADAVVSRKNFEETVGQWCGVHHQLRARAKQPPLIEHMLPAAVENGYMVHRTEWRDDDGAPMVVSVLVDELGHALSGGSPEGTFTDMRGPDTAALIASFCVPHRRRHV